MYVGHLLTTLCSSIYSTSMCTSLYIFDGVNLYVHNVRVLCVCVGQIPTGNKLGSITRLSTTLTSLNLSTRPGAIDYPELDPSVFVALVNRFPALQSLNLSCCRLPTNIGIFRALAQLTDLTNLDLSGFAGGFNASTLLHPKPLIVSSE